MEVEKMEIALGAGETRRQELSLEFLGTSRDAPNRQQPNLHRWSWGISINVTTYRPLH